MAAVRGGKAWKSFIRVSGFPSDNIFFSPPPPAPYHLIICLLFSPALFLLAPTFRNLIKINVNYGWEGKKRAGERKLSYVSKYTELKVTLWPTLIFRKHEQSWWIQPQHVQNSDKILLLGCEFEFRGKNATRKFIIGTSSGAQEKLIKCLSFHYHFIFISFNIACNLCCH